MRALATMCILVCSGPRESLLLSCAFAAQVGHLEYARDEFYSKQRSQGSRTASKRGSVLALVSSSFGSTLTAGGRGRHGGSSNSLSVQMAHMSASRPAHGSIGKPTALRIVT